MLPLRVYSGIGYTSVVPSRRRAAHLSAATSVTVIDWLLDSDPAIRWQALQDLADVPAGVVAAERARVATEGWGARLLALRGEDGQWEGGALFPAHFAQEQFRKEGQPWTATEPTLSLLRAFGVDPSYEAVQRTVAQVRDHCHWEHAGQPFFGGGRAVHQRQDCRPRCLLWSRCRRHSRTLAG